jgi:hypothetical protein
LSGRCFYPQPSITLTVKPYRSLRRSFSKEFHLNHNELSNIFGAFQLAYAATWRLGGIFLDIVAEFFPEAEHGTAVAIFDSGSSIGGAAAAIAYRIDSLLTELDLLSNSFTDSKKRRHLYAGTRIQSLAGLPTIKSLLAPCKDAL